MSKFDLTFYYFNAISRDPVKITILFPAYYSSPIGGYNVHLKYANLLSGYGHQVNIVSALSKRSPHLENRFTHRHLGDSPASEIVRCFARSVSIHGSRCASHRTCAMPHYRKPMC